MRAKLKTDEGRSVYKMRKAIVEPVFGQIKQVRYFRQFSFRSLAKVSAEWDLMTLTHNLLKLHLSGWRPPTARMSAKRKQNDGRGHHPILSLNGLRRFQRPSRLIASSPVSGLRSPASSQVAGGVSPTAT